MNALAIQEKIRTLALNHRIGSLYVFGSRTAEIAALVRGGAIKPEFPHSDIDIGVYPKKGKRLSGQDRVEIALELEDIFSADRVDVVILPEAETFLALDVVRGELIYCDDPYEEAEYQLYILRKAADLAPFARERWATILKGSAGTRSAGRSPVEPLQNSG